MEKISLNIKFPSWVKEYEQAKRKRILALDEVRRFKDIYGFDDEWLNRNENYSALLELDTFQREGRTIPQLVVSDGVLRCMHSYGNEMGARVLANSVSGLVTDEITKQYRTTSLHEIEVTNNNREILNKFSDYLNDYSYFSNQSGVWLCGNKGVGKSTLVGGMANELVNLKGAEVMYLSTAEVVNELLNLVKQDSQRFKRYVERLKTCEMLMLDDIGAEVMTEWTITQLYQIFDVRMNTKRKTWFTSNLTIGEYVKMTMTKTTTANAERLQTRLTTMSAQVKLSGENLRKTATI